jgi:hypothetical protein
VHMTEMSSHTYNLSHGCSATAKEPPEDEQRRWKVDNNADDG